VSSVTFTQPNEDYFIVPDCPLPNPGDLIEHTDGTGKRSQWRVLDRPYQWRTYGYVSPNIPGRLATVFVSVQEEPL
jgi:hypothetical protein